MAELKAHGRASFDWRGDDEKVRASAAAYAHQCKTCSLSASRSMPLQSKEASPCSGLLVGIRGKRKSVSRDKVFLNKSVIVHNFHVHNENMGKPSLIQEGVSVARWIALIAHLGRCRSVIQFPVKEAFESYTKGNYDDKTTSNHE